MRDVSLVLSVREPHLGGGRPGGHPSGRRGKGGWGRLRRRGRGGPAEHAGWGRWRQRWGLRPPPRGWRGRFQCGAATAPGAGRPSARGYGSSACRSTGELSRGRVTSAWRIYLEYLRQSARPRRARHPPARPAAPRPTLPRATRAAGIPQLTPKKMLSLAQNPTCRIRADIGIENKVHRRRILGYMDKEHSAGE